ncbi:MULTISPECIES: hypothetical protein [Pseudomonas aeruginosa group]|uniref:hypothetical protein n=1 Tax=Pseudomonas aeruginosa group TaxID=136841 RepID=UPI0021F91014|nr:hypothetical protein [Pseudomonas aeruginosa]UYT20234.1 hypothetical protein OBG92_02391 [Pseudomonas aeruginosa]
MNTEQFIRNAAARGLSRRATRLALGIGPWVFREMLTLMPDIEWPARGCSADHQRANEQKRGRCTPAQAAARTWPLDHAGILTARGYAPWPKSYIDQHVRPVAVVASLNHKQALRLFGLKLPKPEHQRQRRLSYSTRLNCSGCGRFLTEHQRFEDCPNCGARNAP